MLLCCLKAASLWSFFTAAIGKQHKTSQREFWKSHSLPTCSHVHVLLTSQVSNWAGQQVAQALAEGGSVNPGFVTQRPRVTASSLDQSQTSQKMSRELPNPSSPGFPKPGEGQGIIFPTNMRSILTQNQRISSPPAPSWPKEKEKKENRTIHRNLAQPWLFCIPREEC